MRWFGYIDRKKSEQFVKKVYVSEIDGKASYKMVKDCMHEKGADRREGIELARRKECLD